MIVPTGSRIEPFLKNPPLIPLRYFYIPQICCKSPQFTLFVFFLSHLSTRRSARARYENADDKKSPCLFPSPFHVRRGSFFLCFFTGEEKSESV